MSSHAYHHPGLADFDANKYYFPSGVPPARDPQPWLEVSTERDEQGTAPGLQLVPDEQKNFRRDLPAPIHETRSGPLEHQQAAAHADEFVSPGLQPVHQPPQANPNQWAPGTAYYSSYASVQQNDGGAQHGYWNGSGQPVEYNHLSPEVATHPDSYAMQGLQPVRYGHSAPLETPDPSTKGEEAPMVVQSAVGSEKEKKKRWLLWAIVGVVAVLIIVGATVGGVMSTRAALATASDAESSGGAANDTTSVPPPKTIRMNSRLAVTGYRDKSLSKYTLRLFYQGPDDVLRFMDKTSKDSNWTKAVDLDTLDYKPMTNTSITAGSYLGVTPNQWELFYVDETSTLRGQIFYIADSEVSRKGQASSLNNYPLKVAKDSRLGCYFPFIMSQDQDNKLRWTTMKGRNPNNESQPWWVNDTDIDAMGSVSTGMAVLPVVQKSLSAAGFVYRDADGRLNTGVRDGAEDQGTLKSTAWKKTGRPPAAAMVPAGAAIGAFTVGRPYDARQVNTYFLYQDAEGVLQVVWQDGADGDESWKGPRTFPALAGAAPGTDIACATTGAWDSQGVDVSKEQDMNRCFFQEEGTGRVKEVWFDGTDWRDIKFVPVE